MFLPPDAACNSGNPSLRESDGGYFLYFYFEYLCCLYCNKGKKKDNHNLTGLVYKHCNGDGLGYKCLSCGAAQPRVFRFLSGSGARAAEEYVEKRLEIDAVGKGWYCPNPHRK